MISLELIRHNPFFDSLTDEQLKSIAMIGEVKTCPKDSILFEEDTTANELMLLLEGAVGMYYGHGGEGSASDSPICSIHPGQIFGVSSLIGPYKYTASAYAAMPVKVVDFDVVALRLLTENDPMLGSALMRNVAAAVHARIHHCTGE